MSELRGAADDDLVIVVGSGLIVLVLWFVANALF